MDYNDLMDEIYEEMIKQSDLYNQIVILVDEKKIKMNLFHY